ncbi:DUF6229 family protein [Dyella koreensis]|uniref:Uncharacterized protein n=1 Tax=Dyella koreensis TaxID=311235 RepID=A0ABW8K277_9GAMM
MENADRIAQLRNEADEHNPAGPLFTGGQFAEAEITSEMSSLTTFGGCGTACTGSHTRYCC